MLSRKHHALMVGMLLPVMGAVGACGGNNDEPSQPQASATQTAAIVESKLPEGFEKTPTVEVDGKEWRFDDVPGHYWKVLDDRGFTVGLHFQTDKPFKWAEDVPKGELLYLVYAIPGSCGDGSFAKASKASDASIVGPLPAGFDHWHGLVGGGSETGHWLMHVPVRDFTFAGEEGNPLAGTKVKAANPGFVPVCDIR